MTGPEFGRELIHACEHRMLGEAVPRLRKCLTQLGEEEIWRRPNAETVSVGNLVLHLCGNVGHRVQGHDVSGIAILVHVVEHFSYHVGQITYVVKSTKAVDMGYYEGVDLNQTGDERI